MKALIISDDGPDSVGVDILRVLAKRVYLKDPAVLVTKEPRPASSMSITLPKTIVPGEPMVPFKDLGGGTYEVDGTPTDALYLGLFWPERILAVGRGFDIVLTGVNQGHNCGLDAIHSGTVATAALAASVFGLPAYAFSQQIPAANRAEEQAPDKNRREFFKNAEEQVMHFLAEATPNVPQCVSVNFPTGQSKGYKRVQLAMRSRWFPDTSLVHATGSDMEMLEDGWTTMTVVNLSMAEPMRL